MRIQVNGERRDVPDNISLPEFITILSLPAERIAIEVNQKVMRRSDWQATTLKEGDQVEIVHFVGGGD